MKVDKPIEPVGKSLEVVAAVVGTLDGASEGALLFQGGRAALRAALTDGLEGVSSGQATTLLAKLGKGAVDEVTLTSGDAGSVVATFKRAGDDGYQVIERTLDSRGAEASVIQRAYNAAGKLVHYHPWK